MTVSVFKPVQIVDFYYKASDLETFTMARKLIREEGLLCGRFPDTEGSISMILGVLFILK